MCVSHKSDVNANWNNFTIQSAPFVFSSSAGNVLVRRNYFHFVADIHFHIKLARTMQIERARDHKDIRFAVALCMREAVFIFSLGCTHVCTAASVL